MHIIEVGMRQLSFFLLLAGCVTKNLSVQTARVLPAEQSSHGVSTSLFTPVLGHSKVPLTFYSGLAYEYRHGIFEHADMGLSLSLDQSAFDLKYHYASLDLIDFAFDIKALASSTVFVETDQYAFQLTAVQSCRAFQNVEIYLNPAVMLRPNKIYPTGTIGVLWGETWKFFSELTVGGKDLQTQVKIGLVSAILQQAE